MRFGKWVVLANGLVPAAMIAWDGAHGQLGVNPVEFLTRATGTLALVFLGLTLLVTPARRLLRMPSLGKYRRMLGLFTFAYATAHLLIYVCLDQVLAFGEIVQDVVGRPFIACGVIAWGLMVPMALTSTAASTRRVGPLRWRHIHQRIYAVAILAPVHYLLFAKVDTIVPLATGLFFALLLVQRWAVR